MEDNIVLCKCCMVLRLILYILRVLDVVRVCLFHNCNSITLYKKIISESNENVKIILVIT